MSDRRQQPIRFARMARARRATVIAACVLAAGAAMPVGGPSVDGLLATPSAYANESGDFVVSVLLKPYVVFHPLESHTYIELESWNSGDKGFGSCVGVEGGGKACSSSNYGKNYDEVYCRSSCKGQTGKPTVENNDPGHEAYFTGWGYWQ